MWQYLIVLIMGSLLLFIRIKNWRLIKLSKQLKTGLRSVPLFGICFMFKGTDEGKSETKNPSCVTPRCPKHSIKTTFDTIAVDRMRAINEFGEDALKHGGVSSAWIANKLFVALVDPEMVDLVMKTNLEKLDLLRFLRYVLGNGSIFAPVAIWRPRRKVLAPTFSMRNLNSFVQVFDRQSRVMVVKLRPAAGGGRFSIWKYLTTFTLDSVCETALGVQVHSQDDPNLPFLKSFEVFSELAARRLCQPWLHNDAIYRLLPAYQAMKQAKEYMCGFVDQIIKAKRKELAERNKTEKSVPSDSPNAVKPFLELLIEASGGDHGFSDLELQEETLVMVMAGTDTSATAAGFTLLMLARHPDVQDKVYQEIMEVFGQSDRPVEPEDLPKLKFLEATLKESLRLYPPVPLVSRKIDKEVTLPGSGATLIKGRELVVPVWWLHRNPRYWGSDAHLFRPERFLEAALAHPTQFMPFSTGPRVCLGYQYAMMSMKTALTNLVRHYRVLPSVPLADLQRSEADPLRVKYDIMMKHVDNYVLRLECRT